MRIVAREGIGIWEIDNTVPENKVIKEESEVVAIAHGKGKRNIQRFRIDEDRGPWFGRQQRENQTVKEGAGYDTTALRWLLNDPIPIQTVRVRDDSTA